MPHLAQCKLFTQLGAVFGGGLQKNLCTSHKKPINLDHFLKDRSTWCNEGKQHKQAFEWKFLLLGKWRLGLPLRLLHQISECPYVIIWNADIYHNGYTLWNEESCLWASGRLDPRSWYHQSNVINFPLQWWICHSHQFQNNSSNKCQKSCLSNSDLPWLNM